MGPVPSFFTHSSMIWASVHLQVTIHLDWLHLHHLCVKRDGGMLPKGPLQCRCSVRVSSGLAALLGWKSLAGLLLCSLSLCMTAVVEQHMASPAEQLRGDNVG